MFCCCVCFLKSRLFAHWPEDALAPPPPWPPRRPSVTATEIMIGLRKWRSRISLDVQALSRATPKERPASFMSLAWYSLIFRSYSRTCAREGLTAEADVEQDVVA